jgi:hypothetical protein
MQFAPYEKSQALLCKHEKIADCSYGVLNGKIASYQLDHPYQMRTAVDPDILVFDTVDLYPQAICDPKVIQRGNNNTTYRRVEEACVGGACFPKASLVEPAARADVNQGRAFDISSKRVFRDAYAKCL